MKKLPSIVLLCLLFLLPLSACEAGKSPELPAESQTETEPPRVYTAGDLDRLEISVDRKDLTIGVGETVSISAVGYADDGTVIPDLDIIYYADGQKLPSPYFFALSKGYNYLYAKCGSVMSNSIEIHAHMPEVVSAAFTLKSPNVTVGEKVSFRVSCNTEAGEGKSENTTVTVNGETRSDTVFEMTEKGIYTAYVTCDKVNSPKQVFGVVDALRCQMRLSADLEKACPGDTVHLEASVADLSDGSEIPESDWSVRLIDGGEVGSSFTFEEPGFYSFYIECGGEVSETVTVEVADLEDHLPEGAFDGYSSSLPVIVIDTAGENIRPARNAACTVSVYGTPEKGAAYGSMPVLVTKGEIKVRGQSSLFFAKRQYSLHTVNEDGTNNNVKLLGLPKENDWVLNGSYADKSLIRNSLAQSMLSQVMDYTCRTQYCELYLRRDDGSLDYVGVYTLIESIKIDKNRLDIDRLTAEDKRYPEVTGGYIVSLDKIKDGENTVDTQIGTLTVVKPGPDSITKVQDIYIKNYLTEFASVIKGSKRDDPEKGVTAYVDIDSFAAPLMVTELIRNLDGFFISTYLYKERDGLLHYGPGWDYDLTVGNADFEDCQNPYEWYVVRKSSMTRNLMRADVFSERVVSAWKELRKDILSDEALDGYLDEQVAMVGADCIARSCSRWPDHWNGTYVWPNANEGKYFTATYEEEIERMRTFLHQRAEWIDQHIDELLDYPY